MMCIIKQNPDPFRQITGFLIATDVHDARRKAQSAGDEVLASTLYRWGEFIKAGQWDIGNGYTALVD